MFDHIALEILIVVNGITFLWFRFNPQTVDSADRSIIFSLANKRERLKKWNDKPFKASVNDHLFTRYQDGEDIGLCKNRSCGQKS
jgi:hypothetical protein